MKARSVQFIFALTVLLQGCAEHPAPTPQPRANEAGLLDGVRGAVVYERPDGVYRSDLGSGRPVCLATNGAYPRWSADGRFVAFVRGREIARVTAEGGEVEVLATAAEAHAVACHPNGEEVLFTDGKTIRSVSLKTREVRTLVSGRTFRELDISADGRQLVTSVRALGGLHIRAFDLAAGRDWEISDGCSASLSPDGRLVTNNSGDHRRLDLRRWEDGEIAGTINAPLAHTFDNQFWSNDADWIASVNDDGPRADVFVHRVSRNASAQVTFSGDCNRPDLRVEPSP